MVTPHMPIIEVDGVLLSPDIFTEQFCCDLEACKGECCVEGDAGAPLFPLTVNDRHYNVNEIDTIEGALNKAWPLLSAQAQAIIDKQGVAYTDPDGDLVTSIVNGRDCVFTCYDRLKNGNDNLNAASNDSYNNDNDSYNNDNDSRSNNNNNNRSTAAHERPLCCLCALERAAGNNVKPISCALYPIRERRLSNGTICLNYHRWDICAAARRKGQQLALPLYRFLRQPLVRRFGQAWYDELLAVADELHKAGMI